ncbi:MAG: phage integrase N-terminal SAM-like domain-containing protein [Nitrospirota bacterium]
MKPCFLHQCCCFIHGFEAINPVAYLPQSKRLLEQVREVLRYKHYSLRTKQAYLYWIRFYVRWHGRNGEMQHTLRHPALPAAGGVLRQCLYLGGGQASGVKILRKLGYSAYGMCADSYKIRNNLTVAEHQTAAFPSTA